MICPHSDLDNCCDNFYVDTAAANDSDNDHKLPSRFVGKKVFFFFFFYLRRASHTPTGLAHRCV